MNDLQQIKNLIEEIKDAETAKIAPQLPNSPEQSKERERERERDLTENPLDLPNYLPILKELNIKINELEKNINLTEDNQEENRKTLTRYETEITELRVQAETLIQEKNH
jgi:hypothetical protein